MNLTDSRMKTFLMISAFVSTVASAAITPIRILHEPKSNNYLVILSSKEDWLDRIDEFSDFEATYNLNQIVILWGNHGRLETLGVVWVRVSREALGSPLFITLRTEANSARSKSYIFSLPRAGDNQGTASVKILSALDQPNLLSIDEELLPADPSSAVYRNFRIAAASGILPSLLEQKVGIECTKLLSEDRNRAHFISLPEGQITIH